MHAKYHSVRCNIAGCESQQGSLLLCEKHEALYLSSVALRELQEEVVALRNGTATPWLRVRAILWSVLHYATNARVPYVEHFPLETIYLKHRRNVLEKVSNPKLENRAEECRRINRLIIDFEHPENETLEGLRLLRARFCSDLRDFYNRPVDFSQRLRELVIVGPKAYTWLASIAFVILIGLMLSKRHLNFDAQVPFQLSTVRLVVMYFLCLGLVVGGRIVLDRVGPILATAQSHRLYVDKSDNVSAVAIALRILDKFKIHSGMDYMASGATLLGLVIFLTPWPLNPDLSVLELLATGLVAALMLVVLYPLMTIYTIYANASVSLQDLPQSRFSVDLHAADGRLGVGEVIDLIVSGIAFNVAALVLLWIVGPIALDLVPGRGNWWGPLLYQLLIYPIALLRVAQLRRLWRVRRSLVRSVRQAVEEEVKKLPSLSVSDRNARNINIERTRNFPVLTNAVRGRLKEFVVVVIIPLGMLVGDKIYTAWGVSNVLGNQ